MNYKFRYTGRIVGFFVFIAVLILLMTFFSIAVNRKIFVKKFAFRTVFNDAIGLSTQTPVIFKGFEIGEIKSFNLNNENQIDAVFLVYEPYRTKIVKHSVLRKTIHPLSGKSSIELIQGPNLKQINEENELVPEISTQRGKLYLSSGNIEISNDMMSSIVQNVNKFLYNLNQDNNQDQGSIFRSLYHIANSAQDLEIVLKSTNETISKLNRGYQENDGELFRMLNEVAEIAVKMNETAELINQTVYSANEMIKVYSKPEGLAVKLIDPDQKNIIQPIREILNNLNQNMLEVNQLLKYLESQSPEISSVIVETQSTLNAAQKTIQGLNNNPILRGGIEKENVNTHPLSNHRPNEIPKD